MSEFYQFQHCLSLRPSNKAAKCEVDWLNGAGVIWMTFRQTEIPCFIVETFSPGYFQVPIILSQYKRKKGFTLVFISKTQVELLHCGPVHGSLDSQHVQLLLQASSVVTQKINSPSHSSSIKSILAQIWTEKQKEKWNHYKHKHCTV